MVAPPADVNLSLIYSLAEKNNDLGYAKVVCKYPFSFYVERVKRLGFVGKQRILDLGCGFGHWTAALALQNERVVALERSPARLTIAQEFIQQSKLDNVDFILGDALSLPFDPSTFDAVFCYGVLMLLPRRQALQEWRRILRFGGSLYACTNGFGWWLQLWLKHLFGNKSIRSAAYQAMIKGNNGSVPNSTSRKEVRHILKPDEWEDIETGYEGTLAKELGHQEALSTYPGSFLKFDSVIEFIATKKPTKVEAIKAVQEAVSRTLSKTSYEYASPVKKFPQPRPALDLVNNCYPQVIQAAALCAGKLDRVEQLQWIFRQITATCNSDLERIHACITFAQLHFFHHFAGQPMQSNGLSVMDPIAGLILRFGRCGAVARFLVDLFECNGISARLLTLACHTSAEVLCQDHWILADASLFPPGVYPANNSGRPVGIEEVIASPSLLDRCPSYINYHHEYIEAFLKEYPETDPQNVCYLRAPILPSTGYFGSEFFAGRTPGLVQRLSKSDSPEQWNTDENFGWLKYEIEAIQGPALPTRQRPGQVTNIQLDQGFLVWERPFVPDDKVNLLYRLVVSQRSRGWNYHQLPTGCNFVVNGHTLLTPHNRMRLAELSGLGRYLTIYTEVAEWQAETIFYLPSKEFVLDAK